MTMLRLLLPSLVLAAACHDAPPPAAPAAAAAAAPDPHAATVERMVGVWVGEAVDSPTGDFPIAFAFDREPGGDVHARTDDHRGTYIDLRFHRDGAIWQLIEEAALPDVGMQHHTLVPATSPGGAARWVDRDDPAVLAMAIGGTADAIEMTTVLRGEPHVGFRLRRAQGAEADQVRAALAGR